MTSATSIVAVSISRNGQLLASSIAASTVSALTMENPASGFGGQYLEVGPGEKLVFSWSHVIAHATGEREEPPQSRVEVDFTPKRPAPMSAWSIPASPGRKPATGTAEAGSPHSRRWRMCSTDPNSDRSGQDARPRHCAAVISSAIDRHRRQP